ncbi:MULTISPECIES: OmpA family protein [Deefgea]|uniref:OmpA family protein n=1 Tax=Deefgea chitinilytica TaxID=570276 RepID=A0ABS2CER5_9NEIS|nr:MULTISPECIES: OmpA family protein [Deefgea]MBM5572630.1 OmpA family protein [Deefgea chitinilytica]MBM9889866.1 OmpA family protein [Deefgea sp. CFH1-16]
MKRALLPSLLALSLAITGCSNMSTTENTLLGALGGAAVGAGISKASKGHHTGRDAAIGAAAGALGAYLWSSNMEKQKQAMEQATQGTGIEVSQTPNNELKIEIPADFSFDVGKANIKPNMQPVLNRLAQTLNQNPVTQVRIVGHTDSTGTDAINNPLSVNRAAATRNYLAGLGVASQRMSIDGVGATQPIASNDSAAGRAQNRRVEIFVAEPAQK